RISIGVPSGVPGLVTAIQTFGNYPEKFHPHLHIISTDGLFKKNGLSYVMPRRSLRPLKRLFQAEVFKMLKKEGLLRDEQINILLK
ncbi:MAG: transposase, partial [Nitrospinota bacterium]